MVSGWQPPAAKSAQSGHFLNLEAAEVLEHFQWGDRLEDSDALASELADVGLYLLQLAREAGIDLESAILAKLDENYSRSWDRADQP